MEMREPRTWLALIPTLLMLGGYIIGLPLVKTIASLPSTIANMEALIAKHDAAYMNATHVADSLAWRTSIADTMIHRVNNLGYRMTHYDGKPYIAIQRP